MEPTRPPRPNPSSSPRPADPAPADPQPVGPARPSAAAAAARLAEHRKTLRDDIRAYPGSITYIDLIRRNRRESAVLVVVMILLAGVVVAVIASAIAAYAGVGRGGDSLLEALLPSALLGLAVGLVLGVGGAFWSWFGGASAVLSMSGAKEIQKPDDPELFNVVDEVRIAAGLPMPRVYLIEETALNAFATGRDPKHAAVAITSGLRARLTRDELQAVMAHEMAHVRHLDIRFAMLMATMVGVIVFICDAFLRGAFRTGRYGGRGRRSGGGKGQGTAVAVMIVIALVLAIIAPLVARLIQMSYSRKREYLADAGGVELTRNPEAMASALSALAVDPEPLVEAANRGTAHMFIVNPLKKMRQSRQKLDSLFSSHPPIQKRIARLLALTR